MFNLDSQIVLQGLERFQDCRRDDKHNAMVDEEDEREYLSYGDDKDLSSNAFEASAGQLEASGSGMSEVSEEKDEIIDNFRLHLTPGALDQVSQAEPVRLYYRDMAAVPLLTREREVELARRIERGRLRVSKAMSRSPIVIREIVNLKVDCNGASVPCVM
jgi:RNA polymerase primary sigma factor